MSQLHQMQLTYVVPEDRMLFRLNTREGQEFRFWMTRRYVALLWHTLSQVLQNRGSLRTPLTAAPPDPLVEVTKQQVEHQVAVSHCDFATEYQESACLPLGEVPLLLFSVGVKPGPGGEALLGLHPATGQGIELALNAPIVHSIRQLILETATKAEWGLNLGFIPGPGRISPDGAKGLN